MDEKYVERLKKLVDDLYETSEDNFAHSNVMNHQLVRAQISHLKGFVDAL
jgi:hypothetical protein